MSQVQCPECGGLEVQQRRSAVLRRYSIAFVVLFAVGLFSMLVVPFAGAAAIAFGGLLWLALTALAPAVWLGQHLKHRNTPWYQHGYRCLVCGHLWVQRPGQQLQQRTDPARRQELVDRLRSIQDQRQRSTDQD